MKILFLYPYPLDEAPSQRFRFEQYHTYLLQQGFIIEGQSFWSFRSWKILYRQGFLIQKATGLLKSFLKRIYALWRARDADFVFIHRECTPIGPPVIEWILVKILRKKIIYDFDDSIWLPNTSTENKIVSLFKWHSKFKSICRWSYRISCGNKYLGSVAESFNKKIIINPTTIDTDHLHNPTLYAVDKSKNIVTIGWTGTHSTMKYLNIIIPVIRKLEERFPHMRFLVISNKKPEFSLKSLTFIPWSKENEIQDLLSIDIGIMPLLSDEWSEGKCGFKALQYMALAIPAILSPVGENNIIIDHGVNGYLCETEDQWLICLDKLIQEPSLRSKIGNEGRKKVISHYSVSSNTSTFLSLFK